MNWASENKKLASILGVMIVGGLGLGVWLFLTWSGYSTAVDEWNQIQDRTVVINRKKLPPTPENLQTRGTLLDQYAEKVGLLRTVLTDPGVQQPVKAMSETEFQAKLKDRATELKRLSKASIVMETKLADDFALGFDKYAAQPPRSADVAAELNVHLDVMDKLLTTCIEAGVTSIDMVERTKLPNEDAPLPPKVTTSSKSKATKSTKSKTAKKPVITEKAAAEPVLDRYAIKLQITTDQGPFQTLMNTLCQPDKVKMPHFLVVRLLRVENARLDGPTKEEMKAKQSAASQNTGGEPPAPAAPAAPPKPGGPQLIPVPKPAAKDALDVMGKELLKVYLEVDYIRFREAPAEAEEEAPAKP